MKSARPEAAAVAWEAVEPERSGPARRRMVARAAVGLVVAAVVAACAGPLLAAIAAVVATALLGIGVAWPLVAERWLGAVTRAVGAVLAVLLLAPFYFVVVTPVGWIIRLRRDPLDRRWRAPGSYWVRRPTPTSREDLF